MQKCLTIPSFCFSWITFSLIEHSGMQKCPLLKKNSSCKLKSNDKLLSLNRKFWQALYASRKSRFVSYRFLRSSKPNTYISLACMIKLLQLNVSATLLAYPLMCFNTNMKLWRYSTHFTCLLFNLCFCIIYCKAELLENMTNSFPSK